MTCSLTIFLTYAEPSYDQNHWSGKNRAGIGRGRGRSRKQRTAYESLTFSFLSFFFFSFLFLFFFSFFFLSSSSSSFFKANFWSGKARLPQRARAPCHVNEEDGDVAQSVERRTDTPLTQVRFPDAARNFSPRVNFQCRLSYGVRTPSCVTACINICAHLKDPVLHVRVRWSMQTLKHPACIVGGGVRLCRSWLPRGKRPE